MYSLKRKMTRIITFFLLFFGLIAYGQEFPMDTNPLINSCQGFFLDSGGRNSSYENNENFFTTICRNGGDGSHIRLTFTSAELASGDELCFFDGLDNSAPLLACAADFNRGQSFVIQATAANSSGCLTITFNSDDSDTGNGWEARIDCIPSCQLIQAELINTIPIAQPQNNGWIDVCIGESIFFEGTGRYPQNGLVYEQSNENSILEWDFGDGSFAFGNSVSHSFQKPGGYKVSLLITDQFGCTSSNFIIQRVRVSTDPHFQIGDLPDELCLGEILELSGSKGTDDTSSTVEVFTTQDDFLFSGVRSDSLALPDGNGTSYETSIRFTDFSPEQVLMDISDLLSICVDIEHSWLHDMEISISCPSGQTVILQEQMIINNEVYLGDPNDNDDTNPIGGKGKVYCWVPDALNGTFTEFANSNDNTSPSKPYFLPGGNYNSFEDLENLLGCPLNGDWTIKVTDLWGQDNGFIFSWGIEINPALYPEIEVFQPTITNFQWQNQPDILSYSPDRIIVQPENVGTASYTFTAEDNFGCSHDTTLQIEVLPENHPACLNCDEGLLKNKEITICQDGLVKLQEFIDPLVLGSETFETNPFFEFSFSTHPTSSPYLAPITVSGISDSEISGDAGNLLSVCIDIESYFNADLTLVLVSPNGVNLLLSEENGGASKNYSNTCFTATAPISIREGTGPFEGTYQPEEPFSNLAGTDINGTWQLRVSDDAGLSPADVNLLRSWSISFSNPNNATFSWSPTDNLSCANCIDPVADVDSTQQFILEKIDGACTVTDTLTIKVIGNEVIPNLTENSLEGGTIRFSWDTIDGVSSYEVSIDGGLNWIPSNGRRSHLVEGLIIGEEITILVRAIFDDQNCVSIPTSLTTAYIFCDLAATLVNAVFTTSCTDVNDGAVEVSALGGFPPYTYSLNDSLASSINRFENLPPDDYTILVIDNTGNCADTLTFSIDAPPPVQVFFNTIEPNCFEEANGAVTAIPTGGVGNFTNLGWSNNLGNDFTLTNLAAGTYTITIEDNNGCQLIDTATIEQPDNLIIQPSHSPVTCFGANDGTASVKITGGTPNYQLNWTDPNNQTGTSAVGLNPGPVEVIVTDSRGCQKFTSVIITEPSPVNATLTVEPISCATANDGVIIAETEGGVAPYEYAWSNGQSNPIAFNLEPGIQFVTITDNQGCESIFSATIATPFPFVAITNTFSSLCDSLTGAAQVSVIGGSIPYSYQWNDSNNQTSAIAENLPAGAYDVTVTDANNCQITTTALIDQNIFLDVNLTATPTRCYDSTDGVANAVVSGPGSFTYQWETTENTPSIMGLASGLYRVTVEDGSGCQFIDSVQVETPDILEVDSILSTSPSCNGDNDGALLATVKGGVAPYFFNWDNGQRTNPYLGISAGLHTLAFTDANGCSMEPVNVTLAEPAPIEIALSKTNVPCFGESEGIALANARGGTPPYNYSWNDENGQKDSLATNLLEGVYTVQVVDRNGCIAQDSINIEQPLNPLQLSLIQTEMGCFNQNENTAMVTATGGTGSNFTYSWSSGDSSNIAQNLGSNIHIVTVTDENNCITIDSIVLQDLDSIEVSMANVEPSCHNAVDGRIAVTNISGGNGLGVMNNYTINWDVAPSTNQAVITNLVGDSTYSLTITDQLGCSQTLERYLGIPSPPTIGISKQDISCFGANDGQIRLTSFSNHNTIDIETLTFEWSNNVPNSTEDIARNLSSGSYSLTLTDEEGCSVANEIEIFEPTAIEVSTNELLPSLCSQDAKGIIRIAVSGGVPVYTFQWSNGSTSQNLEGVPAGNYQVNIRDDNGCEITSSFELRSPDALFGEVTLQGISCAGDRNGQINIDAFGGSPPYSYSLDGENFNTQQIYIGLTSGDYTVYIQDRNNCIWESESLQIVEPAPLEVSINGNNNIVEFGDSLILTADFSSNTGTVQFDWDADNINAFSCRRAPCRSIIAKPTSTTLYEVYAVDENGCEANDQFRILVSKSRKVFVPTGFSPNNDSTNDRLIVHGEEGTIINTFKVFNRWGELVFSSDELQINSPINAWDGTFKGQTLNAAVFTWLLDVTYPDGETEVLRGNTTLIR